MKKSFIYLIIVVTLINLTALGTIVYQRWLNPVESLCEPTRESRFEKIKHELDLTESQIRHFEEIRHEFHSAMDSLKEALEGINRQLLQEIWQPQPDNARIDTLLHRISRLQMESQHLVIWHFYQLKKVLTKEQWQKFYGIVCKRFLGRIRNAGSQAPANTERDNQ